MGIGAMKEDDLDLSDSSAFCIIDIDRIQIKRENLKKVLFSSISYCSCAFFKKIF